MPSVLDFISIAVSLSITGYLYISANIGGIRTIANHQMVKVTNACIAPSIHRQMVDHHHIDPAHPIRQVDQN